MSDDESEPDDCLLERQTSGEERVRMVARQLSEPRTARWIANEAERSCGPTKLALDRLVEDGFLRRGESSGSTAYFPDRRQLLVLEVIRLRDSSSSLDELTARLSMLRSRVRDWEDEFGVESPNRLRATIAEERLDSGEVTRRRDVARAWEHLQRRIQFVGFVIREWDFLGPAATATVEE